MSDVSVRQSLEQQSVKDKKPDKEPSKPVHVPPHISKVNELDELEREKAIAMTAKLKADFANTEKWGKTMEKLYEHAAADPLILTSDDVAALKRMSTPAKSAQASTPASSSSTVPMSVPGQGRRRPTLQKIVTTGALPMLPSGTYRPSTTPKEALAEILSRYSPTTPVSPAVSPIGNAFSGGGFWASKTEQISPTLVSPALVSPPPYEPVKLEHPENKSAYEKIRSEVETCARQLLASATGRPRSEGSGSLFDASPEDADPKFLLTAAELLLNFRKADLVSEPLPSGFPARLGRFSGEESRILSRYSVKDMLELEDIDTWLSVNGDTWELETVLDANRDALQMMKNRRKSSERKLNEQIVDIAWATKVLEECEEKVARARDLEDNEGFTYDNFLRSIKEEAQVEVTKLRMTRDFMAEMEMGSLKLRELDSLDERRTIHTEVTVPEFRRQRNSTLTPEEKEFRHRGPSLDELNKLARQLHAMVGEKSEGNPQRPHSREASIASTISLLSAKSEENTPGDPFMSFSNHNQRRTSLDSMQKQFQFPDPASFRESPIQRQLSNQSTIQRSASSGSIASDRRPLLDTSNRSRAASLISMPQSLFDEEKEDWVEELERMEVREKGRQLEDQSAHFYAKCDG